MDNSTAHQSLARLDRLHDRLDMLRLLTDSLAEGPDANRRLADYICVGLMAAAASLKAEVEYLKQR